MSSISATQSFDYDKSLAYVFVKTINQMDLNGMEGEKNPGWSRMRTRPPSAQKEDVLCFRAIFSQDRGLQARLELLGEKKRHLEAHLEAQ